MKIKINSAALALANGKQAGDVVNVLDKAGIPADRYWRNRLRDAQIDNSVEVVAEAPKAPKAPAPTKKEGK